jgi:hypothetical protein
MQEKIELVQVRSLGEIIEDGILFFKQNWRVLVSGHIIGNNKPVTGSAAAGEWRITGWAVLFFWDYF